MIINFWTIQKSTIDLMLKIMALNILFQVTVHLPSADCSSEWETLNYCTFLVFFALVISHFYIVHCKLKNLRHTKACCSSHWRSLSETKQLHLPTHNTKHTDTQGIDHSDQHRCVNGLSCLATCWKAWSALTGHNSPGQCLLGDVLWLTKQSLSLLLYSKNLRMFTHSTFF